MDILWKSIVGGTITGLILWIAKNVSPRIAGALGGIPIIFAITYVLVTMENKGSTQEYLTGGIYGAIASIFFSVVLIACNNYFPRYHWVNFAIVYLLCFGLAFGMSAMTGTK